MRHLSVEEFVTWAYRDQLVDRLSGRTLPGMERAGEEGEARATSRDGIAALQRIAALGLRIPGGGCWGGSTDCHPDAEQLHDIVLDIGRERWLAAALILRFGQSGEPPPTTDQQPVPYPTEPDWERDRIGRAVIAGQTVCYRVAVAERVAERIPIIERRGRSRRVIVGYRWESRDIEYCPLDWQPSPQWIEAVNGEHRAWRAAMDLLLARLGGVPFRSHRIQGVQAAA